MFYLEYFRTFFLEIVRNLFSSSAENIKKRQLDARAQQHLGLERGHRAAADHHAWLAAQIEEGGKIGAVGARGDAMLARHVETVSSRGVADFDLC